MKPPASVTIKLIGPSGLHNVRPAENFGPHENPKALPPNGLAEIYAPKAVERGFLIMHTTRRYSLVACTWTITLAITGLASPPQAGNDRAQRIIETSGSLEFRGELLGVIKAVVNGRELVRYQHDGLTLTREQLHAQAAREPADRLGRQLRDLLTSRDATETVRVVVYLTSQPTAPIALLFLTECPGDLNGDGVTDLADLGILLADFGCTP